MRAVRLLTHSNPVGGYAEPPLAPPPDADPPCRQNPWM